MTGWKASFLSLHTDEPVRAECMMLDNLGGVVKLNGNVYIVTPDGDYARRLVDAINGAGEVSNAGRD